MDNSHLITSIEDLEALYGPANPVSIEKETSELNETYIRWIEKAPFFAVGTSGPGGLDVSPRGDQLGQTFRILDSKTLAIPDRRGNNRLDTLRNLVADPKIALLFLVPGINECVRINGTAVISSDPELLGQFDQDGKLPATAIIVTMETAYFQCARSLIRSDVWNPEKFCVKGDVPSAGQMTKSAAPDFDGDAYDKALPQRQKETLY
ncbi:MAG: pyridoxamine 5'-phosphate oxidase family protein [Sneathiellales bacterium]|nr:pyridoxamine 5'-phosphate oxidase family protein [Sneathiellales bacterium]